MKQHILLTKRHFKNFCSFFLSLLSQTSSHISWTAACPCHAEYNRSVREMSGNKVSADSHLSPGCIPQFPFFLHTRQPSHSSAATWHPYYQTGWKMCCRSSLSMAHLPAMPVLHCRSGRSSLLHGVFH